MGFVGGSKLDGMAQWLNGGRSSRYRAKAHACEEGGPRSIGLASKKSARLCQNAQKPGQKTASTYGVITTYFNDYLMKIGSQPAGDRWFFTGQTTVTRR